MEPSGMSRPVNVLKGGLGGGSARKKVWEIVLVSNNFLNKISITVPTNIQYYSCIYILTTVVRYRFLSCNNVK
jgi:hypothetical protein